MSIKAIVGCGSDPRCGSNAGYIAHFMDGGDRLPGQQCKDAHAFYRRRLWRRKYALKVDGLYIPAMGTQRRIRALQRMGWPLLEIGRRARSQDLTGSPAKWAANILKQQSVHVDTATAIDRVYRELGGTLGPSSRTRAIAIKNKWAPPMAWDSIDDPADTPKGMLTNA